MNLPGKPFFSLHTLNHLCLSADTHPLAAETPIKLMLNETVTFHGYSFAVVPAGVPLVIVDKTGLDQGRPLIAECHAPPSHPPANITFFVNDEKVRSFRLSFLPHADKLLCVPSYPV